MYTQTHMNTHTLKHTVSHDLGHINSPSDTLIRSILVWRCVCAGAASLGWRHLDGSHRDRVNKEGEH